MDTREKCRSGHNKHLCYLLKAGFKDEHPKDYQALIDEPEYGCMKCKRKAAKPRNLCNPKKIKS